MQVTVTGSLGNISRTLVEKLVGSGHQVNVISSQPERVAEIGALGAVPLIGSLQDYQFVERSFAGSEAVYLMIPPDPTSGDLKTYIQTMGGLYAQAIRSTGVQHVVNLSSVGAHLQGGVGPTGANHYVEQRLNALQGVNVLHLRPGMFLTNFYGAIPAINHQQLLGNNFAGTIPLPLTHPRDIAEAAFRALELPFRTGKQVQYVVSDVKNGLEVAASLGAAIGLPTLRWVELSDDQLLTALVQNGFSEDMAKVYIVEIGAALKSDAFMEDYYKHGAMFAGGTTLEDFSREFAVVYKQSYR